MLLDTSLGLIPKPAGQLCAGIRPAARRAHAGIIVEINRTSTLVIQGGRLKHGGMLADVWAATLEGEATQWSCLFDCSDDELSKKKKKKKKKKGGSSDDGPAPRKGHVAFPAPGPDGTKLVRCQQCYKSLPDTTCKPTCCELVELKLDT